MQSNMEEITLFSQNIEKNLVGPIEVSLREIGRMKNILEAEQKLKEIQQIYTTLQKIGYCYDFQARKILDMLNLSYQLKQINPEQDYSEIPEVKEKFDLLKEIRQELQDQTTKKFIDVYEARDLQSLIVCIQVFFNQEMLTDQIQNMVNSTLRALFSSWKVQIQSLNEKLSSLQSKEEENAMVDKSLGIYINDMIRHTQKVYTLSLALAERDPASAYESLQDSLEKTGLSNIFNLYFEKLIHILKQSLSKIEHTEMYSYIFQMLATRYQVFETGVNIFWEKILDDVIPSDKVQLLELKFSLY